MMIVRSESNPHILNRRGLASGITRQNMELVTLSP